MKIRELLLFLAEIKDRRGRDVVVSIEQWLKRFDLWDKRDAKVEELANYDAIVVGAPTRFGRMPSAMGSFWEQAGQLWMTGALLGKVGGAFTSSATQHGGNETTLFTIIANLMHFGLMIVGLPYSHAGQMTLDEIVGGAPYGATTIAGGRGERQPSKIELDGARHQGELIAKTANKLFG